MTRLPRRRVREPMMPERATQREFPRHRRYIRSLQCVAEGCGEVRWLTAVVECCHLRSGTDGGGSLKPSDWWCFPACSVHHREQHQIGEPAFQAKYKLDLRAICLGLARQSPDQDMRRIMRERGIG